MCREMCRCQDCRDPRWEERSAAVRARIKGERRDSERAPLVRQTKSLAARSERFAQRLAAQSEELAEQISMRDPLYRIRRERLTALGVRLNELVAESSRAARRLDTVKTLRNLGKSLAELAGPAFGSGVDPADLAEAETDYRRINTERTEACAEYCDLICLLHPDGEECHQCKSGNCPI